ncbi:Protein tyrosine phosphatase type IVA 1 [Allomyces javanicus]|nr:Protein tyrosine phosphatase type IVA 1 [Allomyces javanicus]
MAAPSPPPAATRAYRVSNVLAPPTRPASLRLLLSDAPDAATLDDWVVAVNRATAAGNAPPVRHLVRLCAADDASYDAQAPALAEIEVHDGIKFADGGTPSKDQVAAWLAFLRKVMVEAARNGDQVAPTIAVHCVSGIGRAPLLVALAYVESGVDSLEAIAAVRAQRRGAFNTTQVRFLADYKGRKALLLKDKDLDQITTEPDADRGAGGEKSAGPGSKMRQWLKGALRRKPSKASVASKGGEGG